MSVLAAHLHVSIGKDAQSIAVNWEHLSFGWGYLSADAFTLQCVWLLARQ